MGRREGGRPLHYYVEAAKENSPLITGLRNQAEMEKAELERLKALYMHSRLELNGDYLFVPVISKDGGRTAFKWNARSATDYYGYDLGESSGSLHAGATWTQPLLGRSSYLVAQEQARIGTETVANRIRMEEHQSEYELLLFLIGNKNRVVSKSAMAEHLSGEMADMMDNHDFVYTHIKNLKAKLAAAGCKDCIKNVYGTGYKWMEL